LVLGGDHLDDPAPAGDQGKRRIAAAIEEQQRGKRPDQAIN
jgi:hypothetical protein